MGTKKGVFQLLGTSFLVISLGVVLIYAGTAYGEDLNRKQAIKAAKKVAPAESSMSVSKLIEKAFQKRDMLDLVKRACGRVGPATIYFGKKKEVQAIFCPKSAAPGSMGPGVSISMEDLEGETPGGMSGQEGGVLMCLGGERRCEVVANCSRPDGSADVCE